MTWQEGAPQHDEDGRGKGDPAETAEQLKAALAERDALKQKWLLAVADLDNYRRRMQKEAEQERRYAVLPLARDILPALDNLQRALESAKSGGDVAQLAQGVQMVARQFDDILARHSVVPIAAVGQPFDPNLHQALQQMPAPDKPPMTVLTECERGYTLHERVVRPSTVIVAAPAS
ncbi:MAG: nucleotide exchange factor GrpE [Planctomycetia bacterium]|nr:nucleotide exchange factor GrpE [Planctomycetia bacterium]